MKTPFEILGIEEDADDQAIKKAYLRKVRENPPERDGAAFQAIRKAYETIQTARHRLKYRLFHYESPDLSALVAEALSADSVQHPDQKTLTATLSEAALEQLLHRLTQNHAA